MKKLMITTILFACFAVSGHSQDKPQQADTLKKEVSTTGFFDGVFIGKIGYRINEYYIAVSDITDNQIDSLKGKKIILTGKLKIVIGKESKNIQSTLEDTKYITEPNFTIVYDATHPLLKK